MKNIVELKLTSEWLGHPPETIIKVGDKQSKLMIGRGVAIINNEGGGNGSEKEKESSCGSTKVEQEEKVVKMQKRNMDKMIKGSINKTI